MKHIIFCVLFSLLSITAAWGKQPQIVLLGDGAMAEYAAKDSIHGWGPFLPDYMSADHQLLNSAKSGWSTKTVLEASEEDVWIHIHKKDYVLISFGINDINETQVRTFCPREEYITNLLAIIQKVKDKKAIPVLVTPLALPYFAEGKVIDCMGAYPEAMRQIAEVYEIALVDLYQISMEEYCQMRAESLDKMFFSTQWEQRAAEYELTEFGAKQVALWVANELAEKNIVR